MAINTIEHNGKSYDDSLIEQATGYQKSTLVGDTLPYNTLEADVWDFSRLPTLLAVQNPTQLVVDNTGSLLIAPLSNTDLASYTYADPVRWSHRDNLIMKQFLQSCKRIGKYKFRLTCASGIGLISKSQHYGGIYAGETLGNLLADIVGGAFVYQIDADVAAILVWGWLPVATRRSNLRKLLEANGIIIRTNSDGNLWFTVPTQDSPKAISDARILDDGAVDYPTPIAAVKITEHAFTALPTDPFKTLFDGDAVGEPIVTPKQKNVTGMLVTFAEPMHDLSVKNGRILESGANYAVLGPSPNCTLTGYAYTHTRRVLTRGNQCASEDATKCLEDCTLVNLMNSELVADRWYQFYTSRRTVQISAVWNGEQPSDAVTFSDPYDDPFTGIITNLDVRLSNTLMADMEVTASNILSAAGNYYSNLMVVSASGSVTIPAECKGKIRYVLIGGGDGGEAGQAGEAGEDGGRHNSLPSSPVKYGASGAGGAAGAGGLPGKVFVGTMKASPGQVLYAKIGVGGKGAVFGGTPGKGGATTFGSASSENGSRTNGYTELLTGEVYAIPGENGVDGGAGQTDENTRPEIELDGTVWKSGTNAETVLGSNIFAFGGLGGGAAVGSDGANGQKGQSVYQAIDGTYTVTGGNGAVGITPAKASNAKAPGSGGTGGHGGGGGGGGGTSIGGADGMGGIGGKPGNGGEAGDGADGLLLIYY